MKSSVTENTGLTRDRDSLHVLLDLHVPMTQWIDAVFRDWKATWEPKTDHRYGKDFAAFVGERALTDFGLRTYVNDLHAL